MAEGSNMPESEYRRGFLKRLFGIGTGIAVATRGGITSTSAEVQRGGFIDENSRKEVPFNLEEVRRLQTMYMEYINPDADPEFAGYIQGLDQLPPEVLGNVFKKEFMAVVDWDNYNPRTTTEPPYIISPDSIQFTVRKPNTNNVYLALRIDTTKISGTEEKVNMEDLEINPDVDGKFHALSDRLLLDESAQREAAAKVFKNPPTDWKTSFGIIFGRTFGTIITNTVNQENKEVSYGMTPIGGGITVNNNPNTFQQPTNS